MASSATAAPTFAVGKLFYYTKTADGKGVPENFEMVKSNAAYHVKGQTEGQGQAAGNTFKNADGTSMRDRLNPHEMRILDGRAEISKWNMDENGFRVVQGFQTKLTPSMDTLFDPKEAEIRKVYYPEIEELAKKSVALADGRLPKYTFALRTQKFSEDRSRGFLGTYSRQTHADFTDIHFGDFQTRGAFQMLTKRGVPEQEAKNMDILFINTWQPFMRPAYNNPLTILDWRTVDPGDFMEITRDVMPKKAADGKMYAYVTELAHNPKHQWVYLSNMNTDEVYFFKQADSRVDGKQSRYAFHTSFSDPAVDPALPGRRSIATNLICAFEKPSNGTAKL